MIEFFAMYLPNFGRKSLNGKRQLPFLGVLERRYRLRPKVKVSSHQKLGLRSGVGFLIRPIFKSAVTFDGA